MKSQQNAIPTELSDDTPFCENLKPSDSIAVEIIMLLLICETVQLKCSSKRETSPSCTQRKVYG